MRPRLPGRFLTADPRDTLLSSSRGWALILLVTMVAATSLSSGSGQGALRFWEVDRRKSFASDWEALRPWTLSFAEVDYLMDGTPSTDLLAREGWARKNQREGHFLLWSRYALAPTRVTQIATMASVTRRCRSRGRETYGVIWDARFGSELLDVVEGLERACAPGAGAVEVLGADPWLRVVVVKPQ